MNTYGFFSINNTTFNQRPGDRIEYPKQTRDVLVSCLAISNLALRTMSYHPGLAKLGATLRIVEGVAITGVTVAIGDPTASNDNFIGRWYYEAIGTGISQVARGALDLWMPHGKTINLIGDVIATPINLFNAAMWTAARSNYQSVVDGRSPKAHENTSIINLIAIATPALALTHRLNMNSRAIGQIINAFGSGVSNFLSPLTA